MQIGLGELNMSVDEFWDYTPYLFQLKVKGKRNFDFELQKSEWERMRFQTTALINKDRKRQDQIKAIDLVEFDWEKNKQKNDKISEMKKAQYLLMKAQKEHKQKNG